MILKTQWDEGGGSTSGEMSQDAPGPRHPRLQWLLSTWQVCARKPGWSAARDQAEVQDLHSPGPLVLPFQLLPSVWLQLLPGSGLPLFLTAGPEIPLRA